MMPISLGKSTNQMNVLAFALVVYCISTSFLSSSDVCPLYWSLHQTLSGGRSLLPSLLNYGLYPGTISIRTRIKIPTTPCRLMPSLWAPTLAWWNSWKGPILSFVPFCCGYYFSIYLIQECYQSNLHRGNRNPRKQICIEGTATKENYIYIKGATTSTAKAHKLTKTKWLHLLLLCQPIYNMLCVLFSPLMIFWAWGKQIKLCSN